MKKRKLKPGWYLNGKCGWYWDGKHFTDHLTGDAVQFSYVRRDMDPTSIRSMEEMLEEATGQVGDIFVSLRGPYDFEEICDGNRITDPN